MSDCWHIVSACTAAVIGEIGWTGGEAIADCRAVRDFDAPDHYLMMATRKGLVKKTELKAYSRPLKSGIIAIKLKEDDELIDCAITKTGDEIVLSTAHGMAIRELNGRFPAGADLDAAWEKGVEVFRHA